MCCWRWKSDESIVSNDKFKELFADLAMHIAAAAVPKA